MIKVAIPKTFNNLFGALLSLAFLTSSAQSQNNLDEASSMNNRAEKLYESGHYKEALPLFEKALAIREKTLNPYDKRLALSLNNLGMLYTTTGNLKKAVPLLERAIVIDKMVLGEDNPDTATDINNLGLTYLEMWQFDKAISHLYKALTIRQKVQGTDHVSTGESLDKLGMSYRTMGSYQKAVPLIERSLSIREKALGSDDLLVADTLDNLAGAYYLMGNYAKALPLFERALKIKEKKLRAEDSLLSQTQSNLALVYQSIGDYEKAALLMEKVLVTDQKAYGSVNENTARNLNNLASIYRSMGDYVRALPLCERALVIREKVWPKGNPYIAQSLTSIEGSYFRMGDYAKAFPYAERALQINEKSLGPDHPQTLNNLFHITLISYLLNKDTDTIRDQLSKVWMARQKQMDGVLVMDEATRLSWQKENLDYRLIDLLRPEQVAQIIITTKGIVLESMMEDRASLKGNGSDTPEFQELQSARFQIGKIAFSGKKEDQDEVKILKARIDSIMSSSAHQRANIGGVRQSAMVTVDSIRKALTPGAALLDFIQFSDPKIKGDAGICYGVMILAQDVEPKFVRLDDSLGIDAAIHAAGIAISTGDEKALVDNQKIIYQKLWASLAKNLPEGTKKLYIGADGQLNFLSFASLLLPDGSFVGEQYDIAYVGSGRDLINKGFSSDSKRTKDIVLFADPVFDRESKSFSSNSLALRSGELDEFGRIVLPPLPGTRAEEATIEEAAKSSGWLPTSYIGDNASKSVLLALKRPDILHLATHGFYLNELDTDGNKTRGMKVTSSEAIKKDGASLAGIGAKIGSKDSSFVVAQIISGGPADKEGHLKVDDKIIAIAQGEEAFEDVNGLTMEKLISKIRGDKGTRIRLRIDSSSDANSQQNRIIEIIRGDLPRALVVSPPKSKIDPMHASGIALTGAQSTLKEWSEGKVPDPSNDGILTAEEVAGLDLDGTWLVTLSACETGKGEAKSGEGVFGLRRAFMMAGAQNLLMTLWPVSDEVTPKIMADFYKEALATHDAPGALAKVQRDWLLKLSKEKGYLAAVRDAGPFAMVVMAKPNAKKEETSKQATADVKGIQVAVGAQKNTSTERPEPRQSGGTLSTSSSQSNENKNSQSLDEEINNKGQLIHSLCEKKREMEREYMSQYGGKDAQWLTENLPGITAKLSELTKPTDDQITSLHNRLVELNKQKNQN